jgi:hypothetical protein
MSVTVKTRGRVYDVRVCFISTQKLVTGPSPGTNPPIYPVVKVDKTRRTETTGTLKVCRYI